MSRFVLVAITIAAAAAMMASIAPTQTTFTVDPRTAPIGQTLRLVLDNRSPNSIALSSSAPWSIFDANNNPVFAPISLPAIFFIPPGQRRQWTWDQRDHSAAQMPAGGYEARIRFSIGSTPFTLKAPFVIENTRLTTMGTPAPGRRVTLSLSAPSAPGLAYRVALSSRSKPGIRLPGLRELPLYPDGLFAFSVTSGTPILRQFTGRLNATGQGAAFIDIPNSPALRGVSFHAAFAALYARAPGGILTFSDASRVQLR